MCVSYKHSLLTEAFLNVEQLLLCFSFVCNCPGCGARYIVADVHQSVPAQCCYNDGINVKHTVSYQTITEPRSPQVPRERILHHKGPPSAAGLELSDRNSGRNQLYYCASVLATTVTTCYIVSLTRLAQVLNSSC